MIIFILRYNESYDDSLQVIVIVICPESDFEFLVLLALKHSFTVRLLTLRDLYRDSIFDNIWQYLTLLTIVFYISHIYIFHIYSLYYILHLIMSQYFVVWTTCCCCCCICDRNYLYESTFYLCVFLLLQIFPKFLCYSFLQLLLTIVLLNYCVY